MKKTPSSRSSHADVQDYADAAADDDVQDDDDDDMCSTRARLRFS